MTDFRTYDPIQRTKLNVVVAIDDEIEAALPDPVRNRLAGIRDVNLKLWHI